MTLRSPINVWLRFVKGWKPKTVFATSCRLAFLSSKVVDLTRSPFGERPFILTKCAYSTAGKEVSRLLRYMREMRHQRCFLVLVLAASSLISTVYTCNSCSQSALCYRGRTMQCKLKWETCRACRVRVC